MSATDKSDPWCPDSRTPVDGIAGGPSIHRVAQALRANDRLDDEHFDRFLPYELRTLSSEFWTPLVVTQRVALWLNDLPVRKVVDIGSGAGKFCVATALATGAEFVGIEQRPRLVAAARELAGSFGVEDRVKFQVGVIGEIPVPEADAYYLFNPFEENSDHFDGDRIDDDVEIGRQRYERDVRATHALLAQLPLGSYVVKYNGYGGTMPDGYEVLDVVRVTPCVLRLWQKVR